MSDAGTPPPGGYGPPPGGYGPPPPGYGPPPGGGYGPPPPGYGPPPGGGYGYGGPPAAPVSNGLATASLVLGIIAFVLGFFVIGSIVGVAGLILGVLGIGKARRLNGKGKGMAVAGTILSALGIAFTVILIVAGVSLFRSHKTDFTTFTTCMNNAGNDVTAQQACETQFGRSITQ
jgi:hypothetical protein